MKKLTLRHALVFSMLGALMFVTTFALKVLPNVHLLALFIIVITRVYRLRALIPIYIYVFLEGVYQGFSPWWIPYLYMWTILWGATMLIPKKLPKRIEPIVYCLLGGVFGLLFGTLWAPYQAIIFGLSLNGVIAWIVAGLPYDAVHGVSNACMCILCVPLIRLLRRLEVNK